MRCGSLRKWRGGRRCVTMTDCSVRLGSEALLGQLLPRAQSDIEVSQSAANDAARLHAGYVCREIQAPGWERHERMSLLCGAMGSPSGGRLRRLRGRMDAAVRRDAENTSRSVARIKRASAQRVARAAYERLSWI